MATPGDTGHSFGACFKWAASPLDVLALLSEKPLYAYELSSVMEQRSHGKFTIAVIDPVLCRLEKQNYNVNNNTEIIDGRAAIFILNTIVLSKREIVPVVVTLRIIILCVTGTAGYAHLFRSGTVTHCSETITEDGTLPPDFIIRGIT